MSTAALYGNGKVMTPELLKGIAVPMGTSTWSPLPHHDFYETIQTAADINGFELVNPQMYTNDGNYTHANQAWHPDENWTEKVEVRDANLFGVAELVRKNTSHQEQQFDQGHIPVIGFRNSNCKDFTASTTLGSQVLVCNNMCYSGDISVFRTHTGDVAKHFAELTADAFTMLGEVVETQNCRIKSYKNTHFWDNHMNSLIVRAIVDHKILPASKLADVIQHWREPEHEEFKPRTLYSAWNAFTTVFKECNQRTLQQRALPLHKLCDTAAGLN
jgi:hypothetical protein